MKEKKFGLFKHFISKQNISPIIRGLDDVFLIPHSRHTENRKQDIIKQPKLSIIIESLNAGIFAINDQQKNRLFFTGHIEYDTLTLDQEYKRDLDLNKKVALPIDYYPNNNSKLTPINRWRSVGSILFNNWLNYCVYQDTPY